MLKNAENYEKLKSLKIFEKVAFEFHDGWTNLVFQLGKDVTELCELTNYELPKMLQIKAKLGTLRFYYDDSNLNYPDAVKNSIFALVSRAVGESSNICETCGKYGQLRVANRNYWFTSCETHKNDEDESITEEEHKVQSYLKRKENQ